MGALRFSRCLLCGISPNRVYTDGRCYHLPGELLPHLFTITENAFGCCFLLHCPGSCLRRTLSVIFAHGSSDFPQKRPFGTAPAIAHPAGDNTKNSYYLFGENHFCKISFPHTVAVPEKYCSDSLLSLYFSTAAQH